MAGDRAGGLDDLGLGSGGAGLMDNFGRDLMHLIYAAVALSLAGGCLIGAAVMWWLT